MASDGNPVSLMVTGIAAPDRYRVDPNSSSVIQEVNPANGKTQVAAALADKHP